MKLPMLLTKDERQAIRRGREQSEICRQNHICASGHHHDDRAERDQCDFNWSMLHTKRFWPEKEADVMSDRWDEKASKMYDDMWTCDSSRDWEYAVAAAEEGET